MPSSSSFCYCILRSRSLFLCTLAAETGGLFSSLLFFLSSSLSLKKKKKKKKKKIRDDEYTKSADVTEEKVLNLTRSILAEENFFQSNGE